MAARRIVSYYEVWTPEDVELGDASERGELDDVQLELDEYDKDDGLDWVDVAVAYLADEGVGAASSSQFHPGIWYSTYGDADYGTGDREDRSYHLKGFPEDEEREIYKALKRDWGLT